MHSLTINNSPTFQGSREILFKEAIESNKKLSKLTQSELRFATEELMQDLNGMVIPKAFIDDAVYIREMLAGKAVKLYESTAKELSSQNVNPVK